MMKKLTETAKERFTVLIMKLTLFVMVFLFVVYSEDSQRLSPGMLGLLIASFLGLAIVQFIVPARVFHAQFFQITAFLVEIGLLTLTIYLTQGLNGDLFLMYFLTILMAGFTRQAWQVVVVAAVSTSLYGAFLWSTGAQSLEPSLLLRIPFLVLTAVMVFAYSNAVRRQSDSLRAAHERLSQLEKHLTVAEKLFVIGQVISGVAHQINSPLTNILGYSEYLTQDPEVKQNLRLRQIIDRISLESKRCQKIVSSLSMFAERSTAAKTSLNLNDLLEECVRLEEPQLKSRNIRVLTDFAPELPAVTGDSQQLQQVFFHLLIHAQEAVSSHRERGAITVRTRKHDGRVRVEVEDDGFSIDSEKLSKMFEPFVMARRGSRGGVGMGLAISHDIVNAHGGRIWAESESDGARVVVEFPAGGETAAEAPAGAGPMAARRILVVEDEKVTQDLFARILSRQGHVTDTAFDGLEAIEKLKRNDYDLVFCDIRLPGRDGWEIFSWARTHKPELLNHWAFVSGFIGQEVMERVRDTGRPLLVKPFRLEELDSVLTTL